MLTIVPAENEQEYRQVRELLAEFIALDGAQLVELGLDVKVSLEFYFASGEEELPGVYAPPHGRMLLAIYGKEAVGCGAFRRTAADTCEMKRMYVRPEYRGKRIGRQLADGLIFAAREAGYRVMRLETTTYSSDAIALYSTLGFRSCEPYYLVPESFQKVVLCMELDLVTPKPGPKDGA